MPEIKQENISGRTSKVTLSAIKTKDDFIQN